MTISVTPVADTAAARPAPADHLILSVARRMAIAGIEDAVSVTLLMGRFGQAYRRPLILMRALMLEIARSSRRVIKVAPPCCGRITTDESTLMAALKLADNDTERDAVHRLTSRLTGRDDAVGVITCFQAVAQCMADLGMPLNESLI